MPIVFLPIAIRAIKPEFLKMAMARMCYFFTKISQKTIGNKQLNNLHDFMPSFDLSVSIKVAMRLSKTFFCTCMASMAWGISKSGQ